MTEAAFSSEALQTNRNGQLTPEQSDGWRARSGGGRRSEVSIALVVAAIGLVVALAPGPTKDSTIKPIIGLVCLLLAAALVVRSLSGADPITRDVRAERVESIEGAITKHVVQASGSGNDSYYVHVANDTDGDQRYRTSRALYQAAPDAGFVRIFYLPRSRRAINFERLHSAAPSELTAGGAVGVAQEFLAAGDSHDPVRIAEARAHAADMVDQIREDTFAVPHQLPPDPRPLTDALLGSWTNPFGTVTFSEGGAVSATMAGGHQQSGRWSVDGAGHLVAEVLGTTLSSDVQVSGDEMVVSWEGQPVRFRRVKG
jgi:hypothetical protein